MSNAISYRLWPLSWPLPWGWVKKLGKLKRCISWTHFQKHSTKDTLISQIQIRNKSQNRSLKVVGHMVEAFRKIYEFLWFMCPCGLWMLCNGPVLTLLRAGGGTMCPPCHVFAYTQVDMRTRVLIFCDFSSFLVWKRLQDFRLKEMSPFSQEK